MSAEFNCKKCGGIGDIIGYGERVSQCPDCKGTGKFEPKPEPARRREEESLGWILANIFRRLSPRFIIGNAGATWEDIATEFAAEALKRSQGPVKKMLADALKEIEWSAVRRVGGQSIPACPKCYQGIPSTRDALIKEHVTPAYADEKLGHLPKCVLANSLAAYNAEAGKGGV